MRQFSIACLCLFALSACVAAQTTEADIAAKLVGKPLLLRGFWAADNLSFDSQGNLEGSSAVVPFTEAGIDVTSVKLKGGSLEIEGQRVALEIGRDDTIRRVPAKTKTYKGKMKLRVAADAGGDFAAPLRAIFTDDLESLTPFLPVYWQDYARKHFATTRLIAGDPALKKSASLPQLDALLPGTDLPPVSDEQARRQTTLTVGVNDERVMHVGGSIEPPRLLNNVNPTFTELARAKRYQGNVELYLWVEKDGSVSHMKIVKPIGLGLDEAAIAAVQKYHFAPALQNLSPTTVDVYIDVNFQIF